MKISVLFGMALTAAAISGFAQANEAAIASGAALAQEKGCAGCHGMDGIGIAPTFPNLAGQYRTYLIEQLQHYRSGYRVNAMMNPQASGLSDKDIFDLSAYYASQPSP